jgi:hypothetical protein
MLPCPIRTTAPPDNKSHVGPFENMDPDVPIPLSKELLSKEIYRGILCNRIE